MLLMPNEVEQKKREQESALVDTRSPEEALASLLTAPAVPLSPWQKAEKEYGTGEAIMRRLGNLFTGGLFDDVLIPEMGTGSQALYKQQIENYADQATAYQQMQALTDIDPSQLTPQHIALGNELGGSAFGEYLTDMYAAQQSGLGGDAAIADYFDYDAYQWSQLSPEKRRDLTDRFNFEQRGEGAFDYRLHAEGKSPEQLAEAEQAKAEGTGLGNEITSDRQTVTGVRRQIRQIDNSIAATQEIRDLIADRQADPGKFAAGMRRIFGVETYEDGRMSATAAQGVVDQLREVSMGAISEKELQLLLGGLLDPSRSPEANLGTLDTALKRLEDNKGLAISDAKSAWGRLSNIEDQAGFLTQAESDDWYYNNLGGGSRIQSIPAFGGNDEYTFQQYVEDVHSELGPFDQPPSRDELVIGFGKMRDEAEEMYNAMIEKEKADKEAADRARLGLDRPWPTVRQ